MITHNASDEHDLKLLKAHTRAWKHIAKDREVDIRYTKGYVVVTMDGQGTKVSRKTYEAWADEGFPWDEEPAEEVAAAPEPAKPARKSKKQAAAVAPEPEPEPEPVLDEELDEGDELDDELDSESDSELTGELDSDMLANIAAEAFETTMREREGLRGKNAARFERGEQMIRLLGISRSQRVPMKNALVELNKRLLGLAGQNMVADFKPITENEATITRKVVEAFGSSGEFELVNAVNASTGDPMVNDAGGPLTVPLTDVAINKLYAVVEYADNRGSYDALLSFAHRNSEKVVKKARSVARKMDKPFHEIIGILDETRMTMPHAITGEPVSVQLDEASAMRLLADMAGEAPPSDVASIKTSRGWFESTWKPLKALFNAVLGEFKPEMVDNVNNDVNNVVVLETILTQYYNTFDNDGVMRVLGALVDSELITEDQASYFVDNFAFQPDDLSWVPVNELASASEEADAEPDPFEEEDASFSDDEDDGF